jgi:hypothetical protein
LGKVIHIFYLALTHTTNLYLDTYRDMLSLTCGINKHRINLYLNSTAMRDLVLGLVVAVTIAVHGNIVTERPSLSEETSCPGTVNRQF